MANSIFLFSFFNYFRTSSHPTNLRDCLIVNVFFYFPAFSFYSISTYHSKEKKIDSIEKVYFLN